jgi:hypothetical protein
LTAAPGLLEDVNDPASLVQRLTAPELRERAVELLVDRGAAQLHDHGLAGEAADVRQRLDEDRGGVGGGRRHDVLLFSLI